VWGWFYYASFLDIEDLTATGTTMVDNESAILYELSEPGSPGEIGIETIWIVIGSSGTLYRFQVKSQFPESGGEMRTEYLRFSFEPGDVQVEEPSWLNKAE